MSVGYPITSGVRYIIAGFCNYGKENSIEQFLEYYKPEMDGYAGGAGFMPMDIIRGMDRCEEKSSGFDEKVDDLPFIVRSIMNVDNMSSEEWVSVATSCEKLDPKTPLTMVVERKNDS